MLNVENILIHFPGIKPGISRQSGAENRVNHLNETRNEGYTSMILSSSNRRQLLN